MKTIDLDIKHFDYNNIEGGLVAVPKFVLRDYFKLKEQVENMTTGSSEITSSKSAIKNKNINSVRSVVKSKLIKNKKTPTWILTREDIDKSIALAMEEYKNGALITL